MVYITTPNLEDAKQLAQILVTERLAACANILGAVHSVYRWEGKVVTDGEVALLLKTMPERLDALINRVKQLHAYKCPCVVAWPLVKGNADFFQWLQAQTQD